MKRLLNIPAVILAGTVLFATTGAAFAQPQAGKGKITVKSRYGNGTLSAPVRKAQYGYQVRLKSGMWYDCEESCQDTLRRESLDFWETRSEISGEGDFD